MHLLSRSIFNKQITQPQLCFYGEYCKLVKQFTTRWEQQKNIKELFRNGPYLSDFCLKNKMH